MKILPRCHRQWAENVCDKELTSGERHVYKIGDRIRKVIIKVEEEYEADSER